MTEYVAAIDQGTTSSRCMRLRPPGHVVSVDQSEHSRSSRKAGWVEHDGDEIWRNTRQVAAGALAKADLKSSDIVAVGITNQRETALLWDRARASRCTTRSSGRTPGPTAVPRTRRRSAAARTATGAKTGLPLATYFAGPKIRWMLDKVTGRGPSRSRRAALRQHGHLAAVEHDRRPGRRRARHRPTNASRTMLMNLETLSWDPEIAAEMGIPLSVLPGIGPPPRSTARSAKRRLAGVPWPAPWATSRRHFRSGLLPPVRPRTPTAPATSCCSTPAPSGC